MHLINNVLQQLERRHIVSGLQSVIAKQKARPLYYWLPVFVIYLFLMGTWAYHHRQKAFVSSVVTPQKMQNAVATVTAEPQKILEAKGEIPTFFDLPLAEQAFAYIPPVVIAPRAVNPQKMIEVAGQTKSEDELQYQQAVELLDKGSPEAAILHLRLLLDHYPQHREARLLLADLFLKRQRFAEASLLLQSGQEYFQHDASYAHMRAQALTAQGKIVEALNVLQAAKPPVSEQPDYYAFMAALHEQLGQYREAITLYRAALQVDPENSTWWMGLGVSLDANHQMAEALQAYAHAESAEDLRPELRQYAEQRMNKIEG